MWKSWVIFLLGLSMIYCGFTPFLHEPANMLIIGVLVVVFSTWDNKTWQVIVCGLLGVWTVMSGFVTSLVTMTNFFFAGFVIVFFSLWRISQQRRKRISNSGA